MLLNSNKILIQLAAEQLQEFKEIFEKKSGKEVSWEDASESVLSLLGLVEIL